MSDGRRKMKSFVLWYVALLVCGSAALYFAANAIRPGPVVSVIAGALWAYMTPILAFVAAGGEPSA